MTVEHAEALVNGLNVSDVAAAMRIELALDHINDIKRFDRRIDEVTLKIHTAVKDSGTTHPDLRCWAPHCGSDAR